MDRHSNHGPLVGSLCSGYGGLDLAVTAVFGGRVAWHADPDPDAARVLAAHWPGVPNLGDITAVDWNSVEPVHVLAAGFPCQPWSTAGRRGGAADARDLWPAVAAAVRALRPALVVLENVTGFAGRREGLGRSADDLAAVGYGLRWTRVRAADAGAPHLRERWWAVAWDERVADADADGREGCPILDGAA